MSKFKTMSYYRSLPVVKIWKVSAHLSTHYWQSATEPTTLLGTSCYKTLRGVKCIHYADCGPRATKTVLAVNMPTIYTVMIFKDHFKFHLHALNFIFIFAPRTYSVLHAFSKRLLDVNDFVSLCEFTVH